MSRLTVAKWQAIREYFLYVPTALDTGNYMYWFIIDGGGYPELFFRPWLAPGMTVAQLQNVTAPLFEKWAALGITAAPEYYQYDSFLAAYDAAFPQEAVGSNTSKTASRLVPRQVENPGHISMLSLQSGP